jgi:hypothetical protein
LIATLDSNGLDLRYEIFKRRLTFGNNLKEEIDAYHKAMTPESSLKIKKRWKIYG